MTHRNVLPYDRVLRVQDNELKTIAPEFDTLTALEQLCLSGNRLSGLPASLTNLKKVAFIYLLWRVSKTQSRSRIGFGARAPSLGLPQTGARKSAGNQFWSGK